MHELPPTGTYAKSERPSLDFQDGGLADQADEVDTQDICCEFGVEASAQVPEGMSMVDFNPELTGELYIHRFNLLAD